jgi:type IV secretory pathway TraG/TraD family ATPase VirD4
LRVPVQESITVTAPPRAGKTGLLADLVLHFCGPVVATSVKSDIYELTSGIRADRGPVAVFNPQRVSDLPSTFAWSPVAGCRDPEVAARRAEAFTGAISVKGTEQEDFWAQQASEFFRAALMAADLVGGDMRLVGRWLMGSAEDAESILERAGQDQWATSLAQLRSPAERTISTIRLLHNKALSFLGNPALAASVLPDKRNAFDITGFLAGCGTLYLIAEAQTEEAPVAPLMACFLNEVHYTAKLAGSRMPGGRLDPPLLMALDEIANIAPVNVPNFMADAGGRGIQMAIVSHGLGQLRARWGEHGAQIISDTAGCKVFLPGITDTALLKAASELCGQTSFRQKGQEHLTRHDICDPAMLRELPDGYALLVRGGPGPCWPSSHGPGPTAPTNGPAAKDAPSTRHRPRRFSPPRASSPSRSPGPQLPRATATVTATGTLQRSRGAVNSSDRHRAAERSPSAHRDRRQTRRPGTPGYHPRR